MLQGLGCAAVASTWTSSPPGKVAEVRAVDHLAALGLHGHSRNTEQNQISSVKKVVSIDLPEYNVAISMSRSDKFVYS